MDPVPDGSAILGPVCNNPYGVMHNRHLSGCQNFASKGRDVVIPNKADGKYAEESSRSDIPKGLRQLLWERGFPTAGSEGEYFHDDKLRELLSNCDDFNNEMSALEKVVFERGRVLLMSPKGHPELVGSSIECVWGKGRRTPTATTH